MPDPLDACYRTHEKKHARECDHQWILPRYFEAQYRKTGTICGTCIKCRHQLCESLEYWVTKLGEAIENTPDAEKVTTKLTLSQTASSFAEQLSRKFRVVF